MNRDEFRQIVSDDAQLAGPIRQAASAGQSRQFSVVAEAAVVALMFPIVKYLLTNIGLPWLHELKRYSEFQRQKIHEWIDANYREEGIDPDAAEAASDALCEQLEQTTDTAAQAAWERLAGLMKESPQGE